MSEIAFYLRLSMSDGDLGKDNKDESNSIENQRLLLQSYLDANDDMPNEAVEYVDDGYTGTNFKRPAFQRMIEDAKKGKIHTIIVKDLSRLGRDYIGVGDYLDQIFPVLGIRFIALNSNYDSNKYIGKTMGLDVAVSNLVNTLYSRDISKKRKSAIRVKWKQGICTAGRVPYGYIKDKTARGGWKIDEEAAAVVKLIFDKANDNYSTRMIATHLNDLGIATPSLHREKQNQYGGRRKVPDSESLWTIDMVRIILRRYEYTGALVHNRREKVQVGMSITRAVPESQRYITENAHDAIVSREEYDSAQAAIMFMNISRFRIDVDYPLKGKIRCGVCNLAMAYHDLAYESKFYCSHKQKAGEHAGCYEQGVSEKQVNGAVYWLLRRNLALLHDLGVQTGEEKETSSRNSDVEQKKMEREIEKLKAERIRQYEGYAEGIISRENYLQAKAELTEQISSMETALERARALLEENEAASDEIDRLRNQAEESMVYDTLTKEMADAFIDTVYIYDDKRIEVSFTFDDLLLEAVEKQNEEGNGGV